LSELPEGGRIGRSGQAWSKIGQMAADGGKSRHKGFSLG
jgi:hypothetical protein